MAERRTIVLGVVLGIALSAILVLAIWRFFGLQNDEQHLLATAFGFLGLIVGAIMIVVWSSATFKGYIKWQGLTSGGAVICGATMALLWAAQASEALQVVAAVGAILLGLLARRFRRIYFQQTR